MGASTPPAVAAAAAVVSTPPAAAAAAAAAAAVAAAAAKSCESVLACSDAQGVWPDPTAPAHMSWHRNTPGMSECVLCSHPGGPAYDHIHHGHILCRGFLVGEHELRGTTQCGSARFAAAGCHARTCRSNLSNTAWRPPIRGHCPRGGLRRPEPHRRGATGWPPMQRLAPWVLPTDVDKRGQLLF